MGILLPPILVNICSSTHWTFGNFSNTLFCKFFRTITAQTVMPTTFIIFAEFSSPFFLIVKWIITHYAEINTSLTIVRFFISLWLARWPHSISAAVWTFHWLSFRYIAAMAIETRWDFDNVFILLSLSIRVGIRKAPGMSSPWLRTLMLSSCFIWTYASLWRLCFSRATPRSPFASMSKNSECGLSRFRRNVSFSTLLKKSVFVFDEWSERIKT